MAVVQPNDTEREQLACTYAALILQDDSLEVTAENITSILKAANIPVNPYFPKLWSRVLKGRNIGDLISNAGGAPAAGGAAASAPAGGAATGSAPAKEEPKKDEKKKKEEKVEDDEDEGAGGAGMGGLFGDEEEF